MEYCLALRNCFLSVNSMKVVDLVCSWSKLAGDVVKVLLGQAEL